MQACLKTIYKGSKYDFLDWEPHCNRPKPTQRRHQLISTENNYFYHVYTTHNTLKHFVNVTFLVYPINNNRFYIIVPIPMNPSCRKHSTGKDIQCEWRRNGSRKHLADMSWNREFSSRLSRVPALCAPGRSVHRNCCDLTNHGNWPPSKSTVPPSSE